MQRCIRFPIVEISIPLNENIENNLFSSVFGYLPSIILLF